MERLRLATVWLGGCSGCHMSFLDLDEWLFELARFADIVFTPFADFKEYPDKVDAVLVEGAVANEDHLAFIRRVRANTQWVIAFGDCAVTGNVTALRNTYSSALRVLERSYIELADRAAGLPNDPGIVPRLLDRVEPLHAIIHVDVFLPGCPPSADQIRHALEDFREQRLPHFQGREIKFG